MAGIVYPHIDPIEMMQCQAEHPVDFLATAHIAGERQCAFGVTNAVAGGCCSTSLAPKQDHSSAVVRENSGQRCADSPVSAGAYDDIAGHVASLSPASLCHSVHSA